MVAGWKVPLEESLKAVESQHKDIFDLSDRFFATIARADGNGSGNANASGIVRNLTHFLRLHLDVEENLMVRAEYPNLQEHKSHHASLAAKIAAVADRNDRGQEVVDEVKTLIEHFIQHHDHADQKFLAYLRAGPCAPAAFPAA